MRPRGMLRSFALALSIMRARATVSSCKEADAPLEDIVIVGDFDDEVSSIGEVDWREGTFTGCSDSHGDHNSEWDGRLDFHHDGATDKGKVAALYAPELAQCGCYQISEWHPGATSCRGYLATAAVDIVDATGDTWRVHVDQSRDGARWNSLGCYDLAAGAQEITSSNEGGGSTACSNGECYWIADAFRLEWRASSCDALAECSPPSPGISDDVASAVVADSGSDQTRYQPAFLATLSALVLALAGWAASFVVMRRRLRLARLAGPKVVYLRPDAWPMHVANPAGDDQLTMPVPPVQLTFTQMPSPFTTSRSTSSLDSGVDSSVSNVSTSRQSSRPRASSPSARGATERGEIELAGVTV
jgi:hypothetical protein